MFKVKDKKGQQIFLRDKVKYEAPVDDMGLLGEAEGLAIGFPAEGMVQVQPLTKGGVPSIIGSAEVEVTYSLVQKVGLLSTNEDLQELLAEAEKRYNSAVDSLKKPRKKAATKRPVKPREPAKPRPAKPAVKPRSTAPRKPQPWDKKPAPKQEDML